MARLRALLPLLALLAACAPGTPPSVGPEPDRRPVVVLVHGMGRTPLSMAPLAHALERDGFRVVSWGYSSTCCPVAELGRRLNAELGRQAGSDTGRVHLVGHSLGTVVIRWAVANHPPVRVGRIVMLAPPNQGSRQADRFDPWLGWMLRPMRELRTGPRSTARTLVLPPGSEVGVIAGARDGKVSLAETHLAGESAHVAVPAGHSFLMMRRDVQRLTAAFLRDGRFAALPVVQADPP